MSSIVIRNLSAETHRALTARARAHARSTEAEVRAILDAAVLPTKGFGSALVALGQTVDGIDIEFPRARGRSRVANFE
jgi:antitoxin FitA